MNNSVWITVLGFYTLVIVGGIYYYEDKITKLNKESDSSLREIINELDIDNKILQDNLAETQKAYLELKSHSDIENLAWKDKYAELKATAGDWQRAFELSRSIQYESSTYSSGQYELKQDPYVNAYGPNLGYHQDDIDLDQ